MDYGSKVFEKLIKEIQEMTIEEYEALHKEACRGPDIEEVHFGDMFLFRISYVATGGDPAEKSLEEKILSNLEEPDPEITNLVDESFWELI